MTENTKDKILGFAHKLFAEKGFTGVSVREIAKICGCNIAAINYHFTNKENLYLQTMQHSIERTEVDIKAIFDSLEEKDIDLFALKVFDHFLNNGEDLRTGFKLILSNSDIPSKMPLNISRFKGPPGGEYFDICLREQFPNIIDSDIDWAVRTIFTQVIHKSLILCNKELCSKLLSEDKPEELMRSDISRVIKMVKQELNS